MSSREPEINELHCAVFIIGLEKNVFWFDVSVDNFIGVKIGNCFEYGFYYTRRLDFREAAILGGILNNLVEELT